MRRMVNIVRTRQNTPGGSAEVGEIDTKAPFQSVKAAVSLFGETTSSKSKAKPVVAKKTTSVTEGVIDKEAEFHLALNELNKLKEQLRGAESAKTETLPELEKGKRTLDELRERLKLVNESKQSIIEASEALKSKAKELEEVVTDSGEQDADTKREEYKAAIKELDDAKHELSNMRREFNMTSDAKLSAFRKSQRAQLAADAHRERVNELSKQISTMKEALAKINGSSTQALQDHEDLLAKKDKDLQSCRLAKEEVEQKLLALKNEHQPLLADNLEVKLTEINAQIASLQDQVKSARSSYLEAQRTTSFELEIAKGSLKQVEEEKTSLQNSVHSLKQDLQNVGKELSEEKRKADEVEALVSKLRSEIEDRKNVLEAGLVNKTSAADASDDMVSSIEQLAIETQRLKQEASEMKKIAEEQIQAAESAREITKEMENKLPGIQKEAEEAKASEKAVQEEIKNLSSANEESTSENASGKINLSKEDYNSMMEKVNESENLADIKVAATMAHVEALVANQQEAARKYEACSKAIEELKMAEEEALRAAEMAEAATTALEAELQRRRQQEESSTSA